MKITDVVNIVRVDRRAEGIKVDVADEVIVEYALAIRIDGCEYKTLLCTPEHLDYLAVGCLASDGIIGSAEDILSMKIDEDQGVAEISLKPGYKPDSNKKVESGLRVKDTAILKFMKGLDDLSVTFKKTGGVHGCALCSANEIIAFHADLGRHNAVDKVIGDAIMNKIDLEDKIIVASCRISTEIFSKIVKRKIPVVASCAAPTQLAVKMAKEQGITLIGFARGERMNIYSMPERVEID